MSPRVSFRVTTYWKRPRGEQGLTQMSSRRLNLGEALDWVLDELPAGALTVQADPEDATRVRITIDWGKVPGEIRQGTP